MADVFTSHRPILSMGVFSDYPDCYAIKINLLRDLLRNEAHECFLSLFCYLKSCENHTGLMTKNELMAVNLIR